MKKEYDNIDITELIFLRIHSARDRAVLFDRYVNGMTHDQLAEKHNFSVSTIKRILRKGRHQLFK